MEMILLNSESKKDIDLILKIAEKMGINSKKMNAKEKEDYMIGIAIEKGKTNQFVDTKLFLNKIRNK